MRKTEPQRPPPERPAEEHAALAAIAALEPLEPIEVPVGWPYPPTTTTPEQSRQRRNQNEAALAATAWKTYVAGLGLADMRVDGSWVGGLRVPTWVNDLARTAGYYARGQAGSSAHRRAVQAVRRALRVAARAQLFRAAVAAKCAQLRAGTRDTGCDGAEALLRWLETRDWADARPGAVAGIPAGAAQGVRRDAATDARPATGKQDTPHGEER